MTPGEARHPGRPALTSRDALLDAARRVGFARLTVDAVVERAKVAHATFYSHWSSVDELRAVLVDDVLRTLGEPTGAALGDEAVLDDGEQVGWAARLAAGSADLAGLLAACPGLARALLGIEVLPAQLDRAHRRLTAHLVTAGFLPDEAAAIVSTAIRVTIAAAVGATGRLTGPCADVGLPTVIVQALDAYRRHRTVPAPPTRAVTRPRHKGPDGESGGAGEHDEECGRAAGPTAAQQGCTPLLSVADDQVHQVPDGELVSSVAMIVGRYVALCGHLVVPAIETASGEKQCPVCAELLAPWHAAGDPAGPAGDPQ